MSKFLAAIKLKILVPYQDQKTSLRRKIISAVHQLLQMSSHQRNLTKQRLHYSMPLTVRLIKNSKTKSQIKTWNYNIKLNELSLLKKRISKSNLVHRLRSLKSNPELRNRFLKKKSFLSSRNHRESTISIATCQKNLMNM